MSASLAQQRLRGPRGRAAPSPHYAAIFCLGTAPVIAAPGEQPHGVALAADLQPVPVMLDLVDPVGPGGRLDGAQRDIRPNDRYATPGEERAPAPGSASSTARPSGVSTSRAASRSIRPRTNIAISVAPVTPACSHSVPNAIQNSSMRSGVERLAPMSGAPFIAGR
jgi:hypothetical protein